MLDIGDSACWDRGVRRGPIATAITVIVFACIACTPVGEGSRTRDRPRSWLDSVPASAWINAPPSIELPQAPCDMLRPPLDDPSLAESDGPRDLLAIGITHNDLLLVVTGRHHLRHDPRVFFGPADALRERRVYTIGTERDGGSMPLVFDLDGEWVHARFPTTCPEHPRMGRKRGEDRFVCEAMLWDAAYEPIATLTLPPHQRRLLSRLHATCFSQERQERPARW